MLGVDQIKHHDKYLGLPPIVGRAPSKTFQILKDRLGTKLHGWKGQFCSTKAGRKVLINAIALAVPSYAMSCFRSPKSVCNSLNSLIANFVWSGPGISESFIG